MTRVGGLPAAISPVTLTTTGPDGLDGDRRGVARHRLDLAFDRDRRRLRTPVDRRRLAGASRGDGDVDDVLVHPDRRDQPIVPFAEGVEQPVVDRDVAVDLRDAGLADIGGELVESGEGIAALDDRSTGEAGVGVVMIDLGEAVEGQRPVGLVAQPEAEIARRDEDEVAAEHAIRHLAGAVDRGVEPVVRPIGVEAGGDAVDLHDRARRHALLARLVDQDLARRGVGQTNSPGRMLVDRLCLDLGNERGDVVGDRWTGDVGRRLRKRAAGRRKTRQKKRRESHGCAMASGRTETHSWNSSGSKGSAASSASASDQSTSFDL